MIVGIISDTHGLLREEALGALSGSGLIIHAGDVGKPEILDRLKDIAPIVFVKGNIDQGDWAKAWPETAVATAGAAALYVLHDLHDLNIDPVARGYQAVVSGHSHKPVCTEHAGVLYINPGSAGPRRFKLPITIARLDLASAPWKVDFIDVG